MVADPNRDREPPMPRRLSLAFALLSALTGCVSPAPTGTFVGYQDGQAPTTRPVKCEATYALVSHGAPAPIVEHRAVKGEQLGFRRQPDGSVVAVAPGYTFPLAPGSYSWEVVPGSVPSDRERLLCETREHCLRAAKWTGITLLVVAVLVCVFVLVVALSFSPNFT